MSLHRFIAFHAARTRSSLARCVGLASLAASAVITTGCGDLDVVTAAYATRAEAEQAGAVARGWVPAAVPPGAHDLREAHDLDANRTWGLFNFVPSDVEALRAQLQPEEIAISGLECDIPGRIEWWPVLLRGTLDADRIKAAGLQPYRAKQRELIVIVNWKQGRAYYWSQ
jgi:hypothetical protein